ncbi:MAG: hypothetical protein WBD07_12500 [Vicinamibacterales bacterium]
MVRDTTRQLRRWLMGILVLGLTGTGVELLLLEHYEDSWQLVPVVLISSALAVLAWHGRRGHAASARAIRVTMVSFLIAGAVGIGLHFRGAAEFQLEIDATLNWWELSKKVMRAKAPPVLAPGIMVQLGLLGLAYGWRDTNEA